MHYKHLNGSIIQVDNARQDQRRNKQERELPSQALRLSIKEGAADKEEANRYEQWAPDVSKGLP